MPGYRFSPVYPTREHERAAERIARFFSRHERVEAVLLTGSCARGKASRDSCLDMAVLIPPDLPEAARSRLEVAWEVEHSSQPIYAELKAMGLYSQVEVSFTEGRFHPEGHGYTTGPDEFELEIGNLLVYSVPLWERGDAYRRLKQTWLPYYSEELREERLGMVRRFFYNNLDHIPPYIGRGLYFQSFNRLYHALGEFLQALFISRAVYPIAYDKWIKEQIVDILELPDLYAELPRLLEIRHFESDEIVQKAARLRELFDDTIPG